MAAIWGLHIVGRKIQYFNCQDQAMVHLCFISHLRITYYCVLHHRFLDECKTIHNVCKTESLTMVLMMAKTGIYNDLTTEVPA